MTPPLDKPGPTEPDLNSPEALARATAQLRALGIDDEVIFTARTPDELRTWLEAHDLGGESVFTASTPDELRAFLRSRPKCAPST